MIVYLITTSDRDDYDRYYGIFFNKEDADIALKLVHKYFDVCAEIVEFKLGEIKNM